MVTISQLRNIVLGNTFEFGFEEISRAYHTTLKAQAELETSAELTVRKRYKLAPKEAVPEVEYDEDGQPSFDFWEEVGELKDEAESATRIIRSAFLIALFHFWERHSNRWVRRKEYHHETVMAWLKAQGYEPNEALLKDLHLAANCAKHGPGASCKGLFDRCSDLFDQGKIGAFPAFEPNDKNLKINSVTLQAFFDAVSQSGPRIASTVAGRSKLD